MATVTGNYVTSAGAPVPAGAEPRVEIEPSVAAVTVGGDAVSKEPQTVTPSASTGAFSFNVIPTDQVLAADFHYKVTGYYLAPTGYGVAGYTRHDVFNFKVYVGADGGELGELVGGVRVAGAWVHVALTPQPTNRQIPGTYYLDADLNNPDLGSGDLYLVV